MEILLTPMVEYKEFKSLLKKKENILNILLRFINSRGIASHSFLDVCFTFLVDYYYPRLDQNNVELNNKITFLCNELLNELLELKLVKREQIFYSELDAGENEFCYYLTYKGAWRVFKHIRKYPKDKATRWCFQIQLQINLEDIYFINSSNVLHLGKKCGPFFIYDDPTNPYSQENEFYNNDFGE